MNQQQAAPLLLEEVGADDTNTFMPTTTPIQQQRNKSPQHATSSKKARKKYQQQSFYDLPQWLVDVYVDIWKQQQMENNQQLSNSALQPLSIKELLQRCVDPESPRWFFLDVERTDLLKKYETRQAFWSTIKDVRMK